MVGCPWLALDILLVGRIFDVTGFGLHSYEFLLCEKKNLLQWDFS
jgi:hypothetical protein